MDVLFSTYKMIQDWLIWLTKLIWSQSTRVNHNLPSGRLKKWNLFCGLKKERIVGVVSLCCICALNVNRRTFLRFDWFQPIFCLKEHKCHRTLTMNYRIMPEQRSILAKACKMFQSRPAINVDFNPDCIN